MGKLKNIIIKADSSREHIEDYIASKVLQKWNTYKHVDDIRYTANMAMINFILVFAQTQGIPVNEIPQEVKEKIAKAGVKIENKLNKILQKQLQKKSKLYKECHND